jgi:hypothetical protein
MSASLIGHSGSSLQSILLEGVDVARELVLLFGIGAKALPCLAHVSGKIFKKTEIRSLEMLGSMDFEF